MQGEAHWQVNAQRNQHYFHSSGSAGASPSPVPQLTLRDC